MTYHFWVRERERERERQTERDRERQRETESRDRVIQTDQQQKRGPGRRRVKMFHFFPWEIEFRACFVEMDKEPSC